MGRNSVMPSTSPRTTAFGAFRVCTRCCSCAARRASAARVDAAAGAEDAGVHTVCVVVTEEFLSYSREVGNDLSTPMPEHGFAGLQPGDRWCLCASRWQEALEAGAAPAVVLEATHARTL